MSLYTQSIKVDSEIWMPSTETVWEKATVLAITDALATVRTEKSDVVQVDLSTVAVFLCNPTLAADVCALHYIHEPGILYNLEQRSGNSEPYTLLGSVLVAVNPLVVIPDPSGILGQKKAASYPHPYGVAEVAYSQMVFAEGRKGNKNTSEEIISNQSIVISGESGSGKTESSKYCLKHLVSRNEHAGGMSNLDERLLSSNPILEAFGNASTVRNHNSSRFGKFLKLHFMSTKRAGDTALWTIGGASVVTYLLERSRITSHNMGERGYHIFYQLRDGAPASLRADMGFDKTDKFKYMTPREDTTPPKVSTKLKMNDKDDFEAMNKAFDSLGIGASIKLEVFKGLAGILHMGNIEFINEERSEGDVAVPKPGGYGAMEWAGKLLGIDPKALITMLVETEVKAGNQMVTKRRDANAASYARDAVAKAAYSQLFEWVVDSVNEALVLMDGNHDVTKLPFIGVLDIFGFESFERNDFEQLLINYANEALQGTFNRQVFQAELDLYKREGLIVDDGGMPAPPDNSECMELLAGKGKTMGLLKVIDAESQTPQANDQKMNKVLQKTFEKNPCMMKPHPKDAATTFIVRHYAGAVVYTVGRFIEKNADRLPKEVGATFEKSSVPTIAGLFSVKDKAEAAKRAFGGASILGKFTGQITNLIDTLESTRDSFIRCVKPCTAMVRTKEVTGWFDRRYVTMQLKCLSIPQTAEVLKSGLPTRVPYEVLTENYMSVLPKEAIDIWKRLGGGDLKSFMTALFWAFEVPPESYRTGMTRVFFKSGELTLLDNVMESASKWASGSDPASAEQRDKVVKRFKYYYARSLWRKSIVKIMCYNRFTKLINAARARIVGAARIQALFRMAAARKELKDMQCGTVMAQSLWRAKLARKVTQKLREEAIAEAKRKAEEARKREEEARRKAEEERIAAEAARKKAEEERKAAEAAAMAAAEAEKAAAMERLEKLRQEEAEALAKEQERARVAAEEAEKSRKEREALEANVRDQEKAAKEAKEREEKEAAEQKKRWEEEEKKAAEAAAAAAAAASKSTGKSSSDKGMPRKKSIVRELKQVQDGVTKEEKAKAIAAAEAAMAKEREVWANSGKVGFLLKQEKGGLFGGKKWKPSFFMLKVVKCELEIYVKANTAGLVGEPKGKPKSVYAITKGKVVASALEDPKMSKSGAGNFLISLVDPKGGPLVLGCKSDAERNDWIAAIKRASDGFVASASASEALKAAQHLKIYVPSADTEGGDGGGGTSSGGGGSTSSGGKEMVDYSKLPAAAQEQLSKIDSLLETGLLSQEEVDQLRPVILAQAKEMMAAAAAEDQLMPINGGQSSRFTVAGKGRGKGAYRQARQATNANDMMGYGKASPNVMVVCEVCSILNAHGGTHCSVCSAKLPKPDAPEQQQKVKVHRASMQVNASSQFFSQSDFGPTDGKWLCTFQYQRGNSGGTFRCFMKDSVSVMDNQTWEQTALYVIGCEFTQGLVYHEQWTARHNWKWYEKSHKQIAGANLVDKMPDFPVVTPNEANSTRVETMKKLKGLLATWLAGILDQVKDQQAFLTSEIIDKFFKIKENVQQDLDLDQYASVYAEIKNADLSAADASTPLTLEEMTNADDAATLLMTYINGDGGTARAVRIEDERVQDMRSVCITAIPRLRASQDVDNPQVIQDLIPQALDVLEHVEKAIQLYNDTEYASVHGANPNKHE